MSTAVAGSIYLFTPFTAFSLSLSQYNDLLKKKSIVEKDKAKIAELIEELDQKKNEALEGAYARVNKVSTVSTLLGRALIFKKEKQGINYF